MNSAQSQYDGSTPHAEPRPDGLPTAIEEILIETGKKNGLSPRNQYDLLRSQIAPGCTDDELAHFLYVCKARGLDPFAKQAYAIRRQTYDREKRAKVWKMTIQTGIDGFRVIAKRAGLEAQDEPTFEYSEDATDDDLNPLGLVKCTVRVWKTGSERPTTTSAYWDEYRQTADDYEGGQKTGRKKLSGKWADMPRTMLAKVAEALTLRRAFPEDLGGIYTPEEMAQADNDVREIVSATQKQATALQSLASSAPSEQQRALEDALVAELRAARTTKAFAAAQARFKAVEKDLATDQRTRVRNVCNELRMKAEEAVRQRRAMEASRAAPAVPDPDPHNGDEQDEVPGRQPGDDL